MKKILKIKEFDVYDSTLDSLIAENLKTFEEAEACVFAHDKKMHKDWLLAPYEDPEETPSFSHHKYCIFHSVGKVRLDVGNGVNPSFEKLCKAVYEWKTIATTTYTLN